MKQLSPTKKRKKSSLSESISFVIKGKLSVPMITREMNYRRTSARCIKKEVEDKVETAKKKGGKQEAKAVAEKPIRKNQYRAKRKLPPKTEAKVATPARRGNRKPKVSEPPIKKEKVNSKRTTAKILREPTKTSARKVTKLPPKVKPTKKKREEEQPIKEEPTAIEDPPTSQPEPPSVDLQPDTIKKEEDISTPQESKKKPTPRKPTTKKLQYKPKTKATTVVKKPVYRKTAKKKPKMKLINLWNAPKPHRVASLNAKAKVHCLYENESRSAILDAIKSETASSSDNSLSSKEPDEAPTRTLRSVPGLRAIGKHWDMGEGTFSSSDESSCDAATEKAVVAVKKAKVDEEVNKTPVETAGKKRRRNRTTEVTMDLKDMVVSKRLASLNAAAILAASYSLERRSLKSPKCEDTDDDSEDSNKKTNSKEKRKAFPEEAATATKSDEDNSIIEVCATPSNKKVAVILNQDTDVTITGVYLNSTTRSTHHEGYCSIAGMQYRISATSHTQTAATAVATETLLQPSGNGAGQDNVSRKRTLSFDCPMSFACYYSV